MNLPTALKKFVNQARLSPNLTIPAAIAVFIIIILVLSLVLPKARPKQPQDKRNIDQYTKATTVTTADGKTQGVPQLVMEVTPEQLKNTIDTKQKVTLVEVVAGAGWNYPHIKGAILVPLKNFDYSTSSLDPSGTHILVSDDGYDGAVALTKLLSFGFPREKNFNLQGGLKAWKAKGYPVEQ